MNVTSFDSGARQASHWLSLPEQARQSLKSRLTVDPPQLAHFAAAWTCGLPAQWVHNSAWAGKDIPTSVKTHKARLATVEGAVCIPVYRRRINTTRIRTNRIPIELPPIQMALPKTGVKIKCIGSLRGTTFYFFAGMAGAVVRGCLTAAAFAATGTTVVTTGVTLLELDETDERAAWQASH
jgi:hypothetical protein